MRRARAAARRGARLIAGIAWLAVALQAAHAQSIAPAGTAENTGTAVDPARLDEDTVRFRTNTLILTSLGVTAAYGRAKWWQDGFGGGFKVVNEGWFGQSTPYGGADKLGHGMYAYASTRLLTRAFEWAGNGGERALKLGAATAVGTLLAVEVVDGYSRKWRFSKEDALLDLAGGALGYWMETHPALDELIDIRLQYERSVGPDGKRGFDPFGDYSGQRYLVVFKGSGVPALSRHTLWRHLELSVGYGTRNFESESRALYAPTREVSVGVSINLSELLRSTVFKGRASPSRTQRVTETVLEYVQLPGTRLSAEHTVR